MTLFIKYGGGEARVPAELSTMNKSAPVEIVVELDEVNKDYGDKVNALSSVSFKVASAERVAIMGPSGSGKSTLLNLTCGLDEPTSGVVKVHGVILSELDDDRRTRLRREKIGMVFQTFNLLPTLTALENASLPLRLQGLKRREAESRGREMLERMGLGDRLEHKPDELSGGERQRVAIARAVIYKPPLLLADEPTGNLDSATGDEILSLLDHLHDELGTTIIMVTHNEVVAAHCDRILVLRDGRIGESSGRPT
jgi:putative ABC transport system ATP-binding protein